MLLEVGQVLISQIYCGILFIISSIGGMKKRDLYQYGLRYKTGNTGYFLFNTRIGIWFIVLLLQQLISFVAQIIQLRFTNKKIGWAPYTPYIGSCSLEPLQSEKFTYRLFDKAFVYRRYSTFEMNLDIVIFYTIQLVPLVYLVYRQFKIFVQINDPLYYVYNVKEVLNFDEEIKDYRIMCFKCEEKTELVDSSEIMKSALHKRKSFSQN